MADDDVTGAEAAAAMLVHNLFSDQFDALLLRGIPEDAIVAGMHLALSSEMRRIGGAARAATTMREWADEIENHAAAAGIAA